MAAATAAGMEPETSVQIVRADDDGVKFGVRSDVLKQVFGKIPYGMPVAVLSVVGKFRTGKSFLLDFFLKYLRFYDLGVDGQAPVRREPPTAHGKAVWLGTSLGGAGNPKSEVVGEEAAAGEAEAAGEAGFQWRSGDDRTTTGIWMWNRPFFLRIDGELTAVLVVDTQGMFDTQTSNHQMSAIFGLGSLLSSVQIFNISRNISQQDVESLGLFAMFAETVAAELGRHSKKNSGPADTAAAPAAAAATPPGAPDAAGGASAIRYGREGAPLQHVEFLCRDAVGIPTRVEQLDVAAVDRAGSQHLHEVFQSLAGVHGFTSSETVERVYRRISCAKLPHPGHEVAEDPGFDGELARVRPLFLALVESYVHRTISQHLKQKQVFGSPVSAEQLRRHFESFCQFFMSGKLPDAVTTAQATIDAAARGAFERAIKQYRAGMRATTSPKVFVPEDQLMACHKKARAAAVELFDSSIMFGDPAELGQWREALDEHIEQEWKAVHERNKERDVLGAAMPYVYAGAAMLVVWLLRFLLDMTCAPWASVCQNASQTMSFVLTLFTLGVTTLLLFRGKEIWARVRPMLEAARNTANAMAPAARAAAAAAGSNDDDEDEEPEQLPSQGLRRRNT